MNGSDKKLVEAFELYNQKHEFKPGDLVEWKQDMKNKIAPAYKEHMVFVRYDTPQRGDSETGSTYFAEYNDCTLGFFHKDGEFLLYSFNSNRFEPAK